MEIEELTTIIKMDLNSLNKQIAKLQDLGRQQRESFGSINAIFERMNELEAASEC